MPSELRGTPHSMPPPTMRIRCLVHQLTTGFGEEHHLRNVSQTRSHPPQALMTKNGILRMVARKMKFKTNKMKIWINKATIRIRRCLMTDCRPW